MGFFEREFIVVPEDRKNQLVYKWPDVSIRRYSRAIVNADEIALFVDTGRVVQTLGPGRHRIDAAELPGLGAVADILSGSNAYRAELYFVGTRELPGVKFGGRLDDIVDPRSEQIVGLRVFGEYAVTVADPVRFITTLVGTVNVADPTRVTGWCSDQLLKCLRVAVTRGITAGEWPVLGISAFLPDIEATVLNVTNLQLYDYGVRIARMGNFDISVTPEDADRLKQLAKAIAYTELAGGFQQYAAGEMALEVGRGMAEGHAAGVQGGLLATGLGMNALSQHQHQLSGSPVEPFRASGVSSSDTPLEGEGDHEIRSEPFRYPERLTTPPIVTAEEPHCANCSATLPPSARFCSACGRAV